LSPEEPEFTSEGPIDEENSGRRRKFLRRGKPKKAPGGRMILERLTQTILPPGSDENPNVPGV